MLIYATVENKKKNKRGESEFIFPLHPTRTVSSTLITPSPESLPLFNSSSPSILHTS